MKRIVSILLFIMCSTCCLATEYLGDIKEDSTIYWMFPTFDANSALGTPTVKEISVLRLADKLRIETGITADMNFTIGKHIVTIDTSADSNYATGYDYVIDVNCTVDNYLSGGVAQFSIENRSSAKYYALLYSQVDQNNFVQQSDSNKALIENISPYFAEANGLMGITREYAYNASNDTNGLTTDVNRTEGKIDEVKAKTDLLSFTGSDVSAVLSANGLSNIPATDPNNNPAAWDYREWLLWGTKVRWGNECDINDVYLKTHDDNNDVITLQTVEDNGTTQTVGKVQAP